MLPVRQHTSRVHTVHSTLFRLYNFSLVIQCLSHACTWIYGLKHGLKCNALLPPTIKLGMRNTSPFGHRMTFLWDFYLYFSLHWKELAQHQLDEREASFQPFFCTKKMTKDRFICVTSGTLLLLSVLSVAAAQGMNHVWLDFVFCLFVCIEC